MNNDNKNKLFLYYKRKQNFDPDKQDVKKAIAFVEDEQAIYTHGVRFPGSTNNEDTELRTIVGYPISNMPQGCSNIWSMVLKMWNDLYTNGAYEKLQNLPTEFVTSINTLQFTPTQNGVSANLAYSLNRNRTSSVTATIPVAQISTYGVIKAQEDTPVIEPDPELYFNGDSNLTSYDMYFDASGNTTDQQPVVNTNTSWVVRDGGSSWVTISPQSGQNGQTLEVTVDPNTSTSSRTTNILLQSIVTNGKSTTITLSIHQEATVIENKPGVIVIDNVVRDDSTITFTYHIQSRGSGIMAMSGTGTNVSGLYRLHVYSASTKYTNSSDWSVHGTSHWVGNNTENNSTYTIGSDTLYTQHTITFQNTNKNNIWYYANIDYAIPGSSTFAYADEAKQEQDRTINVSLSKAQFTFESDDFTSQTATLTISSQTVDVSSATVNLQNAPSWATVSYKEDNKNGTITVTPTEQNTSSSARSANVSVVVTVGSKTKTVTFKITQNAQQIQQEDIYYGFDTNTHSTTLPSLTYAVNTDWSGEITLTATNNTGDYACFYVFIPNFIQQPTEFRDAVGGLLTQAGGTLETYTRTPYNIYKLGDPDGIKNGSTATFKLIA